MSGQVIALPIVHMREGATIAIRTIAACLQSHLSIGGEKILYREGSSIEREIGYDQISTAEYQRRYTHLYDGAEVEALNWRVTCLGPFTAHLHTPPPVQAPLRPRATRRVSCCA